MTAPVCRVVDGQRLVSAQHPLATRSGAEAFAWILAADQHWRPVSRQGKAALRLAYTRALAAAVADGAERVPLPALSGDVHPATVRGLVRRGLAADGRLTPLAVTVLRWALPVDVARRPRPVDPGGAAGDRL